MTSITLELEERHMRLKPFGLSTQNLEENSNGSREEKREQKRNYSRNYGYYNSTRYAARLISLAFGAYYVDRIKFREMYLIYTGVTLILILFLFIYFRELIVR